MPIHAALVPALATGVESSVCIVVDVLRATTTLAALLDAGCADIVVAETIDQATTVGLAEGRLLCGEQGGLPPKHFDFGNSPRQFASLDLFGRRVAFATTNGTRALQLARSAPLVLAGCIRNASAVASAAVEAATRRGLDVQVICAGRGYGRSFALDDAFCAGMIVDRIVAAIVARGLCDRAFGSPVGDAEADSAGRWALTDSAIALRALCQSFRSEAPRDESASLAAFQQSASGQGLARIGLAEDVAYCAVPDATSTVPMAKVSRGRVTVGSL